MSISETPLADSQGMSRSDFETLQHLFRPSVAWSQNGIQQSEMSPLLPL